MNDLRYRLPECPLEYEVPHIQASHTALVIEINAADIDWQERMLPWTLASLINNTDLVMKGVHLYVVCEEGTQDRIKTALKQFDLPPGTIGPQDADGKPLILFGKYGYRYDSVCILDVNYWAFRGIGKAQDRADIKLPLGHVLRHTYGWAVAEYRLHIANEIDIKDAWVRMSEPLSVSFAGGLHAQREKIREYLVDASAEKSASAFESKADGNGSVRRGTNEQNPDFSEARAKWLHDANTAVYGEDYEKQNRNVAPYFFNEGSDPNWHLDASILHYTASEVKNPYFAEWAPEWEHLGTEALVALWLLRNQQHAYNLKNSFMIEQRYVREAYPRLCHMQHADVEAFRTATTELMGAQLNLKMN